MVEIATRSKSLLQMQLSLWPLGFESRRQKMIISSNKVKMYRQSKVLNLRNRKDQNIW